MALIEQFDGPIPGENYTSDTKNYPWHRPPEFTELDDAIEFTAKHFRKRENAVGLMTLVDMGTPINVLTRTYVIAGIGQGRWTTDFAVLLAGPVAMIISQMAKNYGIEFNMGLDESLPPTKPFLEALVNSKAKKLPENTEPVDVEMIQDKAAEQEQPMTETLAPKVKSGFMSRQPEIIDTEEV